MQFGGDPDQAGQYQASGLHYIYYHIYYLVTRGWATSSRDKLQVDGLNLHHKAEASRGGRYSAPWAPSQLWRCTQPRTGRILTKWNASWECWKLSSMYCRTDNAPSLTMGYSNLEKTWWGEKKANEKVVWYHDMSEKDPAGKGGTGHPPHLQSHLLSRRHPQSTLKIPSGLESLIQACAVPGTPRCRALGDPDSRNIPPDLLIDEATRAQRDARFSKMCLSCFMVVFGTLSPTFQAKR